MAQIEAVRVAQDAAYAASLSDADWQQLAQDPTWQELVAEQSELVSSIIAIHGHKLPGAARAAEAATREAAVPAAVHGVGTDVARVQGLGGVTELSQDNGKFMVPGMLFIRT